MSEWKRKLLGKLIVSFKLMFVFLFFIYIYKTFNCGYIGGTVEVVRQDFA